MSGLVELARYNWVYQADLARAFLASHGLHSVVFDSGLNLADGGGTAFAVRLMILDEDHEAAVEVMRDYVA